jgi:hypothetical protein
LILTDITYYKPKEMNTELYFNFKENFGKIKQNKSSKETISYRLVNRTSSENFETNNNPHIELVNMENNKLNYSVTNTKSNNVFENQDDSLLGLNKITQIYKNKNLFSHEFSQKDYFNLNPFDASLFDRRDLKRIFLDELKEKHIFLTIFLKNSLLNPTWKRIIWCIYNITIIFFLNALFYTDSFIDERIKIEKSLRVFNTNH